MNEGVELPQPEVPKVEGINLSQEILGVLDTLPERKALLPEIKNRQKEILDNLKPYWWTSFSKQLNKEDPNTKNISGSVFENLVRADSNICPEDETKIAKTLRLMMQGWKNKILRRLGFKTLKNPDLAKVNEEGVITGWVEAKTGQLDLYYYDQIAGIQESFIELLDLLSHTDREKLKKEGFNLLAQNADRLKMVHESELDRKLAVPRDAYQGRIRNLLSSEVKDLRDIEEFEYLLETDYKVVESPFSREEIVTIADYLIKNKDTLPPRPANIEQPVTS